MVTCSSDVSSGLEAEIRFIFRPVECLLFGITLYPNMSQSGLHPYLMLIAYNLNNYMALMA